MVREGTSKSKNRIYYAQKGDIVTCHEIKVVSSTPWLKVTNENRYQSKIGWMMSEFVDAMDDGGTGGSGDTGGVDTNKYRYDGTVETARHGTGGTVNLRETAKTTAKILTTIPNGTALKISAISGEWVRTVYKDKEGFVQAKFIKGTEEYDKGPGGNDGGNTGSDGNDKYPVVGIVETRLHGQSGSVNLRKTASTSAALLAQIPYGTSIRIRSKSGEWVGAIYNGKEGFVQAKFIEGTDKYNEGLISDSDGDDVFAGHYAIVTPTQYDTLNVRQSIGGQSMGTLKRDTIVCCTHRVKQDNVSGEWVRIYWGGTQQRYGYVMAEHLTPSDKYSQDGKEERAIKIANSMKKGGYPYKGDHNQLGLTAEQWCVQYVSWLMRAAGCLNHPAFSGQSNVSGAIAYFEAQIKQDGSRRFAYMPNATPHRGDWVMYTTTGSQESDRKSYYAHVGFVVDVNGDNITTVEGNLGKTIASPGTYNYKTETHVGNNNYSVLGFAAPDWS